jgi:hypothetical protein
MTPRTLALTSTVALVAAAATFAWGVQPSRAGGMPAHSASVAMFTTKAVAFHDAMRELWEYHGTYTERAIVDYVAGNPDTTADIATLLRNQVDIGNAVKPYYGAAGGKALTKLLTTHINDAVAVLKAAKAGDAAATKKASAAFYANGNQIAGFLHNAHPPQPGHRARRRPDQGRVQRFNRALQELHRSPQRRHGRHAEQRHHQAVPEQVLLIAEACSSLIAPAPSRAAPAVPGSIVRSCKRGGRRPARHRLGADTGFGGFAMSFAPLPGLHVRLSSTCGESGG